jgi:hypothetical protein
VALRFVALEQLRQVLAIPFQKTDIRLDSSPILIARRSWSSVANFSAWLLP